MFDTIEIDKLAVSVVEGETSNLACFFICVGFVGMIFGTARHKLYNVFSTI